MFYPFYSDASLAKPFLARTQFMQLYWISSYSPCAKEHKTSWFLHLCFELWSWSTARASFLRTLSRVSFVSVCLRVISGWRKTQSLGNACSSLFFCHVSGKSFNIMLWNFLPGQLPILWGVRRVCGECWRESEVVVLNLDRKSVGHFRGECWRDEMGSESS